MFSRSIFVAALFATAALLDQSIVHAQSPSPDARPIVVDVEPDAAGVVSPEVLREAVAREIQAPALAPSPTLPAGARGTLTIALDAERRVVLTYRDLSGNEIFRVVAVPGDPTAAIATLALIAGNLARNDADALLAQLAPAIASAAVPVPIAPPPVAVAPPPGVVVVAPAPIAPPESDTIRALQHPIALGIEGYMSSSPDGSSGLTPISLFGITASYTFSQHFALGINHVSLGGVGVEHGDRFGISAGPFFEAFTFATRWVQPFAQVGVPIQQRWGGNIPTSIGVAPYAGIGARFWIGRFLTVALGARGYYVASDGYLVSSRILPHGAITISAGLELAVHL